MKKKPINSDGYTDDELLRMTKDEATDGVNEMQQRFAEQYVRSYNIYTASKRAGYDRRIAYGMLRNPKVARYILWLKARILRKTMVDAGAIIEHHVRIAFSDITDFIEIRPTSIRLKPEDQIDGQLVKSIKSGRDGISIELYDKLKSLDFLAKYCEDMPKEWKQRIDERRIELQEQEFEFKKKIANISSNNVEDDGFMEAIKQAAEVVWEE